ncbi:peptidase family M1-domain-containing protein [Entophlyctis helioformis]|nr:peptidase family M1-domain-containing protein [Entophlyctis helioformis]
MTTAPLCPTDPTSFANSHEVVVRHSHIDMTVDFAGKLLRGTVDHTIRCVAAAGADRLVLDSSFVKVPSATVAATGAALKFELADRHDIYGSAVIIQLPAKLAHGEELVVRIGFETTDKCTALQWLEPSQTVGKQFPYLFSQCQAIHARSLLPCQDTPGVKHTYTASVTSPSHLRALMSAVPTGETEAFNGLKTYKFEQKTAIPSYLIAVAAGNIVGKRVGPRTTVWSEPEVVEAAAWEFVDTETFIKTGEELLTPYTWGIYDLLLLPASFPYGGMENPCLTYVTPTLLAGDRSLVDVVAHEIAHSWMGNLVTPVSWEHFWLNEGFTVFIERKIVSRLHGEPSRHFSSIIGFKALKESVDHFDEIKHPEYSCLCPRIHGNDPDDVFSSVPYEKGYNLLFYLEKLVGGPAVFEPYVKAHVEKFSHTSITSADFKNFLFEYFRTAEGGSKIPLLESVDWESWFFKAGMPIVDNHFDTSLAVACESLANRWDAARSDPNPDFGKDVFDGFNSNQKVMFFEKLLDKPVFAHHTLQAMDKTYHLAEIQNAEIKCRWQWLCLNAEYEPIFPAVTAFITSVGRMKFVRPLYRALAKCKNGRELAVKTFTEHRSFYHPICAGMVAKDLGV